ncbi:hypothetical protein [Streptomyces cinnamoneus]|uniref:hypothetical protein n=1 Tax=Streptomyces cinnamoneus TaxID=53446 RepID=UPI000CEEF952|nr:hypothetical protein [Streptomyces cinnamoneus]PPT14804.1 hypothetical protein CYQ11_19735 [Streptomyces cinnamoneus]
MAATPKNFFRGPLPSALTSVYTVPAGASAIVTNIVATNPTGSAASVAVKLGGVYALANVGIAPNGVLTVEMSQVLNAGDKIEVQGNAQAAPAHISGVEAT